MNQTLFFDLRLPSAKAFAKQNRNRILFIKPCGKRALSNCNVTKSKCFSMKNCENCKNYNSFQKTCLLYPYTDQNKIKYLPNKTVRENEKYCGPNGKLFVPKTITDISKEYLDHNKLYFKSFLFGLWFMLIQKKLLFYILLFLLIYKILEFFVIAVSYLAIIIFQNN